MVQGGDRRYNATLVINLSSLRLTELKLTSATGGTMNW